MSYAEKAIDRTPFIPGAGVPTEAAKDGVSADLSIRQDLYFKPDTVTPDNIKKYRDSTRQRVGVKQLHPGIFNDPKDYEELVHGIKTAGSDHVPDCIKGANIDGNKYFMNQLAENQYASSRREPLGKGLMRNYKFPEEVKKPEFRFGVPTTGFVNAKDLIYNSGPLDETDAVKKLYYKTHGLTDPGQQSKRDYNWAFDPNDHQFGYGDEIEQDGVKKSLMTDNLFHPYPQSKIVDKRLDDFLTANTEMLGKGKFHGSLHPKFYDPDHVFGKESQLGDAWNAGRCIHGDGSTVSGKSVEADPDLGKNRKYAEKLKALQPQSHDPNRAFGVPSIRSDLPKKESKSVTDTHNYGDEPDVYDLLYPHPEHFRGVNDPEFEELMTKEEIFDIMKRYDFNMPEDEYNLVYEIGLKNYPNQEGKMSPKSFISTMRNLKREYQKYRVVVNNPC